MKTEKKEWKWPLGIFLFYTIFVIITLSFVFFTFTQRTDLVAENYYEKTLDYQDQIDREQNAVNLENPFRYEVNGKELSLAFPQELLQTGIEGQIVFYRPSDSQMDMRVPISVNQDGTQQLALNELQTGFWKLQVSWASDGVEYYTESNIYLQ